MSIVDLALEIRESLLRPETDGVRLRLVRQFLMDIGRAGVAVPSWSSTTDRFLNTWWFLMPLLPFTGSLWLRRRLRSRTEECSSRATH
jgi:hypothetical protein